MQTETPNTTDGPLVGPEYNTEADPVPMFDVGTGAYVDQETGEIIGLENQPDEDSPVAEQLAWLGERRTQVAAKLAGVLEERAYWEARVREQFDPEINHLKATLAWLVSDRTPWYVHIRMWAEPLIRNGKKASVKAGLLTMRIKRSRESLEVVDEAAAIEWAKRECPDAIQVKESLVKGAIPEELRSELDDSSGLVWHRPGETEEFVIE